MKMLAKAKEEGKLVIVSVNNNIKNHLVQYVFKIGVIPKFVFIKDWGGDDKLERVQRQTEKNQFDLEAWSILLRAAQSRQVSQVRALYEHVVAIFPGAARYWKIYIEHEVLIES